MAEQKAFTIIKSSGEEEPFSYEKYKQSLIRSGLSEDEAQLLINDMAPFFHNRMTTKALYGKTFQILKKQKRRCASRYALKQALRALGPTGFTFEKLVEKILQHEGYTTKIDQAIQGRCVKHEVDILAHKDSAYTLVECKFHNTLGLKTDVQVCLYTHARCEDIAVVAPEPMNACMLVTNTQFTFDAIEYGECMKLSMLAWGYPRDKGIETLIERYCLYPVTVLISLNSTARKHLIDEGIILCSEVLNNPSHLNKFKLSEDEKRAVLDECASLSPSI